MELFFREMGKGYPLFVLHGLYGSSDNWLSVGKELAKKNRVILVDQRNHGNSPHDEHHTFELMVEDVKRLFDKLKISKANLLGHSMGGKTAMQFALTYPDLVNRLVVVDISPKSYVDSENSNMHASIIKALCSLDLGKIQSREDADEHLKTSIKSRAVRQFLLKNLRRNSQHSFEWKINISALENNLSGIFGGFEGNMMVDKARMEMIKSLFIKGGKSNYLDSSDEPRIKEYFPGCEIVTVENAGHWVHAEQPEQFLEIVDRFLD